MGAPVPVAFWTWGSSMHYHWNWHVSLEQAPAADIRQHVRDLGQQIGHGGIDPPPASPLTPAAIPHPPRGRVEGASGGADGDPHEVGGGQSGTRRLLGDDGGAARRERAAERDHAEAQYALGTFYADGRGVAVNPPQAPGWDEKAATRGVAEAANSLGRLYENGIGVSADREKAIEWYYRAAVGFKKTGRREDAEHHGGCDETGEQPQQGPEHVAWTLDVQDGLAGLVPHVVLLFDRHGLLAQQELVAIEGGVPGGRRGGRAARGRRGRIPRHARAAARARARDDGDDDRDHPGGGLRAHRRVVDLRDDAAHAVR